MNVNITKEKQPFFSVIIPVYNKAPHISRSIRSVINQSFAEFELLIIDDASTDSSLEEIKKQMDNRIRLFHRDTPGPGGYAARNLGIKKAKAEWVVFLDADDEWLPDYLEEHYKLINKYKRVKVFSTSWKISESINNKRIIYNNLYNQKNKYKINKIININEYLIANIKNMRPVWTSAICINKYILNKSGKFPEGKANRGGDVDTWLRVILEVKEMIWSSKIGAIYHCDSINMVTKTSKFYGKYRHAECECETVKKYITKIDNTKTKRLLMKYINKRILNGWIQSVRNDEDHISNNILVDRLYKSEMSIKAMVVVIFSYMPKKIIRKIFMINYNFKKYL